MQFVVPKAPTLPAVEWVTPQDDTAVVCLDNENVKNAVKRDTLIENYVRQLESTIKYCK